MTQAHSDENGLLSTDGTSRVRRQGLLGEIAEGVAEGLTEGLVQGLLFGGRRPYYNNYYGIIIITCILYLYMTILKINMH